MQKLNSKVRELVNVCNFCNFQLFTINNKGGKNITEPIQTIWYTVSGSNFQMNKNVNNEVM